MELSTSRPSNSWGSRHKRDHAGSPGAGRAKLRLSRGFPRCLAHDVIPYRMGRPVDRAILGDHVTSGVTREAPALVAKLRLSRGSPRCLAHDVIPYGMRRASRPSNSWGGTSQAGVTREAPVRAEPHPTSPRCLVCDIIPYGIRRPIDRAIPEGFTFTSGITREAPVRAEPHPTSWCASAGREAEASIFNRPRSRAHSRYRSLIVTVQRAGRTRTSTIGRTEGGRLLLLRRHVHTPVRSPTPPQGKLRSLSDPFVSPRGDPRQS
jgi:hypothetical protein